MTQPAPSLGKRLLPALVLTTSAAGLVVLLDRPSGGSAIDLGGNAASGPDAAAVTNPAPSPTAPTPTPTISAATPVSPSVVPPPVSSTTLPSATPPVKSPTSSTPPAAATCKGHTVDGPTVSTRWGPVQVEAVVSSTGQICN